MIWFWGEALRYSHALFAESYVFYSDQYYPEAGPDPLASPLLATSHAGLPPTRKATTSHVIALADQHSHSGRWPGSVAR